MKKSLILIFFIISTSIFAIYSKLPDNKLHIYICDVGQGDGILITYKSTQIVIDAGPDNSIESCLGAHMPFWDRTIEVTIMTHADSDHSFGFIEMLKRYKVSKFIGSAIETKTKEFQELKKILEDKNTPQIVARNGQEIKYEGLSLKVIFPTQQFFNDNPNSISTNDFCAITFLTYGKFSGLFSCDTSPFSESAMLSEGIVPHAYFLKVPHHGSKNGLTQSFLEAVNPKLAAISVGAKNRYGHPSPEIIQMLNNFGTKTLRTDKDGEIEVTTDGKKIWGT